MKTRFLLLMLAATWLAPRAAAQALTEPGHPYSTKTAAEYPHTGEPPLGAVTQLLDVRMRDTCICRTPDGIYYLTGTTGENIWEANEGIELWRSPDLKNWEYLGFVWTIERDGTWQKQWTMKNGKRRRAVWAPEIHFLKGNFYIPYCITGLGTHLLKSATGKPQGPYVSATTVNAPLARGIDASLFEDDDGTMYFLFGSGWLARMKKDLSGLAEEPVLLRTSPADMDPEHHHPSRPCRPDEPDHVGFEGVQMIKVNGRYYLSCAERYYERYHCMTAEADSIRGPFHARYVSVPYGGHNNFFRDGDGRWWSTIFGNDKSAPLHERPGILRIEFDHDGHIRPLVP
jgi:beta-xylosidase